MQKIIKDRIALFALQPAHPLLRNHSLTGNYKGFRSINITGDWRAVYRVLKDNQGNTVIVFEALGTHSQLYK
jgi:addiction module RelE/StbE family toxin